MSVLVLAVVGFAGFRIMKNQDANVTESTVPTPKAAAVPAKITSKAQAHQAGKALDAEAIDKTLDSSALDSDLKSVL